MIEAFATLAIFWFLAAATPGPNFFAVMQIAAGRGRRAALACALGTVIGTALWAVAGFFGLKALFAAFPATAVVIRMVGACYLIWVGIMLWRKAVATDAVQQLPTSRAFLFGLATNLANPKTAAFAASIFAVALPPDAPVLTSLAAILLVCLISTLWYGIVAVVGSTQALVSLYRRMRMVVMRVTGAIFAGFGLKLLAE
ncbi:MAG: LysE family transporter [Pseudomonadota bacterium]